MTIIRRQARFISHIVEIHNDNHSDIHAVQVEMLKYSDDLQESEGTNYVYNLSKFDTVELPEDVQTIDSLGVVNIGFETLAGTMRQSGEITDATAAKMMNLAAE